MAKDLQALFKQLTDNYTPENLKTISAGIISSYQKKEYGILVKFARRLQLDGYEDRKNMGKIFVQIIKNYHPDKLSFLISHITKAFGENDRGQLEKYARWIGLDGYVDDEKGSVADFDVDIEEEYVYDEDAGYSDFDDEEEIDETDNDMDFDDEFSEDEDESNDEELYEDDIEDDIEDEDEDDESEVYGFKEAIHEEMLGNLVDDDVYLHPRDLIDLQDINLSDRGLQELSGIEHCHNLTILDLSDNEIINIGPLSKLESLIVLDLSGNEIGNIFPLASLENLISLNLANNEISGIGDLEGLQKLIYLDLSNNHVADFSVLEKLPSLTSVILTGNDIEDETFAESLRKKGIIVVL